MDGKVLVAYASRTGYTAGVAERIASTLVAGGLVVDVLPVREVRDASAYQAYVVGSAIQGSAWLPEAIQFLRKNQTVLTQRPVVIFQVCMTLAMRDGDRFQSYVSTFMNPVRVLIHPIAEASFAGGLDIQKVPSLADRIKFKLSVIMGVWREGDHRDWKAIDAWGEKQLHTFYKKC